MRPDERRELARRLAERLGTGTTGGVSLLAREEDGRLLLAPEGGGAPQVMEIEWIFDPAADPRPFSEARRTVALTPTLSSSDWTSSATKPSVATRRCAPT